MKNLLLSASLIVFSCLKMQAQGICNEAGNLIIYSNYDGGTFTINIDQNIPDIRIGLCSYEDFHVTITGPYAANVTEVRYAGYNNDGTTSVTGVAGGIVTILNYPPATLYDPDGNANMVCAYECDTAYVPGGCNTVDQATDYFITEVGGAIRYSYLQYGLLSGTFNMSDGGNCCVDAVACAIVVDAGQDQSICIGDTVQLAGTGATTYNWFPGTGLSNVLISNPYAYPTTTTTYILTGSDGAGCGGIDTIVVTVNPLPIATISATGANLTASGGTAYQWLFNGEIIPGATDATYTATETGSYSVIVFSADGCEGISQVLDIFVDGIKEDFITSYIKIFPNPAYEIINLNTTILNGEKQIDLINALGQIVYTIHTSNSNNIEIPLQDFINGIYQLRFINADYTIVKSCVVKH